MGLNPFKDSDLESLNQIIKKFISNKFGFIVTIIKEKWYIFQKKAKEQLTIMLIPHSEKKIINFHIPIYTITLTITIILLTITVTSIAIINHASTIKDVSKLKMYGSNSKIQISKYKKEINKLYNVFQKLKPEITYLYSLTNEKDVDSLWAKGGVAHTNSKITGVDILSPPIEVLNIQEVEQELTTTQDALKKIKSFLEARKKIIENTPSLWPTEGYIISKFGAKSTNHTYRKEFKHGIEIGGFPGTEIRSTAPGKVENISWDPILGLSISISHKYGFKTKYSHCQRVSVEIDQKVSKGETIGYLGKTGKVNKHMCFYQIKIGTEFVNPMPYLNKLSY